MIVMEADFAVMDDLVSERVCLLLEKSRSTETLTAGMARISRATHERTGNERACC
jgi:hypothetical protein